MEETGLDLLPVLIGQTGPLNGQKWTIEDTIHIGREATCEIAIPDRQVSRFHARISINSEGITLEDLASKNGTYCNGEKIIEPRYLQDGDLLQIALIQHFVFISSDATLPINIGHSISEIPNGIFVDKLSRRVLINQQEISPSISVPQFRLLNALYENQGKVVSRQELILEIWGDDEALGISEQALDALVRRLRDKITQWDPEHQYIITMRGHGLRLDNRTT
ncbi:MAG: FHA domain-containing protein [Anaerolineaceae bacterium]|nr:FHA domain-containing protein [Anaerolineaceae bacterium]